MKRLSPDGKIKAAQILGVTREIKKTPNNLKKLKNLLKNGFEKIDYLEIRDEKICFN